MEDEAGAVVEGVEVVVAADANAPQWPVSATGNGSETEKEGE